MPRRVNLTSPDRPPRNPNIAGTYKGKPKPDPRYTVKKRGGGLGYVRVVKPKAPPKPKAPAAPPKPPPGPYDQYKTTAPWAIPGFEQIDRDQAAHQSYVSDKVMPWLSSSLQGIQGFQDAAQSSYQNTIGGAGVGALGVAAGMTPLGVSATTPGGVVAGNNQYLTEGGTIRAQGAASSMLQESANAARMNKLAPIPISQGAIQALADYQKNLPLMYVERRRERTEKVDQWIAEQQQAQAELAEKMRSNRVDEAIRSWNAQSNAAIAFGRLGIDAEEFAADQSADAAAAGAPAPYGYFRDVDGNLVRDPSVPQATSGGGGGSGGGTSTRDDKGRPKVPVLQEKGYVGGWANRPKSVPKGARVVQAADNRWYMLRPGTSGSGAKPKAGSKPFDVQKDLIYSVNNGFIDDSDQNVATGDLLRFLRKHQPQKPAAFVGWWKQVLPVLERQDPNFAQWMAGYVLRRQRDGSWKGRL